MGNIAIAIDGPAGAGKSTLSKRAAAELGLLYIDTGAMYRAAALFALQKGIDSVGGRDRLIERLDEIDVELQYDGEGTHVFLNGLDVTAEIRTEAVSMAASDVAVIPEVRKKLVELQRKMAENASVIMDGRDIGTHVLPNADLKIFLTADAHERAVRRYKENVEKGIECDLSTIEADIIRRDKNDSERSESPLRRADDAVLFDTTSIDFEESLNRLKSMIRSVQCGEAIK